MMWPVTIITAVASATALPVIHRCFCRQSSCRQSLLFLHFCILLVQPVQSLVLPPLAVSTTTHGTTPSTSTGRPLLVFSGSGLFFYWQAGVVTFLRENGYDLSNVDLAGASAGALTATLTATNVDFYEATDFAMRQSEEAGVWDRTSGLQGIWGPLIEEWLDGLLPEDAPEMVNGKASGLVPLRGHKWHWIVTVLCSEKRVVQLWQCPNSIASRPDTTLFFLSFPVFLILLSAISTGYTSSILWQDSCRPLFK